MGRINKFGLTDDIPADVRRIVRRECGFGCVLCGIAILQYDHFDPEFHDAKEHRSTGIAALCGGCHDKRTRGLFSVEKVAHARKHPVTFAHRPARDFFDIQDPFTLWIGSSSVENVSCIVSTREGDRWLTIAPAEEPSGPALLSAEFFDDNGALSLEIRNNEWRPSIAQWDTEVEGRRIIIRRGPRDIVLQILAEPPNGLRIERLRMTRFGVGISIAPDGRVKLSRDGTQITMSGCSARSADTIFRV